jgi:hypothetical protein
VSRRHLGTRFSPPFGYRGDGTTEPPTFVTYGGQPDGSCALLNRACSIAGLDPEGARLLRVGSNAVYRLSAPVIVRISRPGADVDGTRRTVAVARWLESVGYPSVRVVDVDVDQPIVIGGHAVTWPFASTLLPRSDHRETI